MCLTAVFNKIVKVRLVNMSISLIRRKTADERKSFIIIISLVENHFMERKIFITMPDASAAFDWMNL